ncbi:MAG: hypothetical protein ACOX50_04345 [Patescibacteria group bacterium]|jgi:cell division protein FtsL
MKKTVFFFVIGIVFQLFLNSQGAGHGSQIASLDGEIEKVKEENLRLELQIAKGVSCSTIAQKANEAGFVPVAALNTHGSSVALRR